MIPEYGAVLCSARSTVPTERSAGLAGAARRAGAAPCTPTAPFGGMDQSVEVAPAPVVAEWRGAEALGLTLGRDLRIEQVEPSVGEPQLLEVS